MARPARSEGHAVPAVRVVIEETERENAANAVVVIDVNAAVVTVRADLRQPCSARRWLMSKMAVTKRVDEMVETIVEIAAGVMMTADAAIVGGTVIKVVVAVAVVVTATVMRKCALEAVLVVLAACARSFLPLPELPFPKYKRVRILMDLPRRYSRPIRITSVVNKNYPRAAIPCLKTILTMMTALCTVFFNFHDDV